MQQELKRFAFCPSCAAPSPQWDGTKRYTCAACGWEFYQNTAAAVIGILIFQDQMLFTRRNQEPGKGMLDLPGGFTDPGESSEASLRREIREELGIELGAVEYLGSFPNVYPFRGTEYTSCDAVFLTEIDELPMRLEADEISGIQLLDADKVPLDQIPFASVRNAVTLYINTKRLPNR